MSSACIPVLVGVVSLVSEIWLPFKNSQISLSEHGLYTAQKIHANRGWYVVHAHQF